VAYLPMDGDCPANPTNTYALSKAAGEMILRDFVARPGMECVALRYPGMYFPHPDPAERERHRHHHHHHHHAPSAVAIAQGFSFLSFPDAARLIDAVLRSSLPGFRVYLPAISRARGDRVPEFIEKYYKDVPLRKPVNEIASLIDISRITRETGWSPQDVPA
jgi:nucleoside-diphosphate-sugar epimerase